MIVGGVGSNEREEQDEWDKYRAANQSELGQIIQNKKTDADGDNIGDDQCPDHGKGKDEMLIQHIRSGHNPEKEKRAQENRHGRAARNSKRNGWDK